MENGEKQHKLILFDNWLLVALSFIDLIFGVISLVLTNYEWQLCSLISSCLTLIQVVRIMILYKSNIKAEVLTLILAIIDVATGVLSVLLFIVVVKALTILISGTKVFKASKVAIQTTKALELIKPTAKKVLPLVSTIFIRLFKNKPNIYKETKTMEKKDSFKDFIKNNPRTIIGVVFSVVASAASGVGTSYSLFLNNVKLPFWAEIIVGVVVFLAFAVLSVIGVVSEGFETNAKVQIRKIASQLGYDSACESLEQALEIYKAEQEKEKQLAEQKAEQEKARYKQGYLNAVVGGYVNSFDDYIAEQKALESARKEEQEKKLAEREEQNLKQKWVLDIQSGKTTLSFDSWKAEQK